MRVPMSCAFKSHQANMSFVSDAALRLGCWSATTPFGFWNPFLLSPTSAMLQKQTSHKDKT